MSELAKTGTFAGAALVALLLAWFVAPQGPGGPSIEEDEKRFFAEFKPQDAASLEIIQYDEDTGTVHPFKVSRVDGIWSIPSHQDYPADAELQLAEAAASVVDLEKLGLVSNEKSDHALYGVVDPNSKEAEGGAEGVGMRVTLEDKSGKKLANFIIGKEVKDQSNLRYVRVPGQDAVFSVAVQPDKLSTNFEDWIEKDLLKLNTFDIKQVVLNNYSIDEVQGRRVQGDVLELEYNNDSTDKKWNLKGLQEGEELLTAKLDGLKTALDDLKIIDVRRKPAGISGGLKQQADAPITRQDLIDLQSKGFFMVDGGQLLSNEGEVLCSMNDGVVYVLRFGEIATNTGGIRNEDKKPDAQAGDTETDPTAPDKDDDKTTGANRYIFVTAQFDPKLIPPPELEPLPVVSKPETSDKPADAAADEKKTETDDKAEAEQPDDDAADCFQNEVTEPADENPADEPQPEGDTSIEALDQIKQDGLKVVEKPIVTEEDRKAVEKENQRKQDEYDEKVKKGQERVKELNARFADWYYVISNEEYQKIHLSRADIVKQAEPKSEDDTASDNETPAKPNE